MDAKEKFRVSANNFDQIHGEHVGFITENSGVISELFALFINVF